jgi:hypothetical protein
MHTSQNLRGQGVDQRGEEEWGGADEEKAESSVDR